MAETISMPKLGFDMSEGTLVRWVRVEGETVEKGQVLAEIETDKATVEVESTVSGVVYKHLVEAGTVVPVGTPIVMIAAPGEQVTEPAGKPAAAAPAASAAEAAVPAATQAASPAAAAVVEGGRVKISPLARKLAAESQVNVAALQGSGPGGRIVRADVEAALAAPKVAVVTAAPAHAAVAAAAASAAAAKPAPVMAPAPVWAGSVTVPEDQHVPLDRLRSAIGRRMTESKQQVPHFYVTHAYNVEPMLALRSQVNALLPDDQKITVNDFIIKAVALTLRQFSNLNASIKDGEIIRHGHVNVGVAVAVGGGLLTVVSKDADQKPLRLISAEIRDMVTRARSGKVRTEDIEGSTFSISNLGMYDVEHFIAIINPPEAAILAVGSAMKVPVVEGETLKVGTRMKATISADHRVSDGAEAAQFMQTLATYLESPMRLLL